MFGSCASPCREDISSGPSHNSTATGGMSCLSWQCSRLQSLALHYVSTQLSKICLSPGAHQLLCPTCMQSGSACTFIELMCTAGEGQQEQLSMEGGVVASSVARDLLDATDLHFPMEDTSVLE